ncbi:MAG: hypothetical protein ACOH10_00090 [Rhodoglobus sp.]
MVGIREDRSQESPTFWAKIGSRWDAPVRPYNSLLALVIAIFVVAVIMLPPIIWKTEDDPYKPLQVSFGPQSGIAWEGKDNLSGSELVFSMQEHPDPLQQLGIGRKLVLYFQLELNRSRDGSPRESLGWVLQFDREVVDGWGEKGVSMTSERLIGDGVVVGMTQGILVLPRVMDLGDGRESLLYEGWAIFEAPVSSQGLDKFGTPVQSWSMNWVPPLIRTPWTMWDNSDGQRAVVEYGLSDGPAVHIAACPSCGILESYAEAKHEVRDRSDWWTEIGQGKRAEFATSWKPFAWFYSFWYLIVGVVILAVIAQFGRWSKQRFIDPLTNAPAVPVPPDARKARQKGNKSAKNPRRASKKRPK